MEEDGALWHQPDRIELKSLSCREDYLTLFHEALHAISFDHGIGLSERDVLALEQAIVCLLMDNEELREGLFPSEGTLAGRGGRLEHDEGKTGPW